MNVTYTGSCLRNERDKGCFNMMDNLSGSSASKVDPYEVGVEKTDVDAEKTGDDIDVLWI
jgi:hypothetical protein